MSAEENKALVQGFIDALGRGDPADAARRFHREYRSNSWEADLAGTWEKMQAARQSDAFGDVEVVPQALVAEGDRVVRHATFHATHAGEFLGVAPRGRRIEFHFIEVWRIQDGKIIEHWGGLREAQRLYEQLTAQERS